MLECIAIITKNQGSLSTVVGDEKLTSREDRIGPLFMYVQCDEDTLLKVDKVSKTKWEGNNQLGGYVWHTTGSGKTMTSFKSAQLIASSKDADKVVFLMDRI